MFGFEGMNPQRCSNGVDKVSTCSSIAQSVEHAAVNRSVVGSSPTQGVRPGGRTEKPVQRRLRKQRLHP